jgi:hypothetical protein
MEDFFMSQFSKRTASTACQTPPYRPTGPLLCRPWDLQSLGPLLSHTRATCLRPAQACTSSTPSGHATKACHASDPQAPHNLHGAVPLRPAQACTISTRQCPSGLPGQRSTGTARSWPGSCPLSRLSQWSIGMHDLHWDCVPKACQAGEPQTCTISTPQGPCP